MKLENMINGKKLKKTVIKDHALHNSIYMTFSKIQNHSDGDQISFTRLGDGVSTKG